MCYDKVFKIQSRWLFNFKISLKSRLKKSGRARYNLKHNQSDELRLELTIETIWYPCQCGQWVSWGLKLVLIRVSPFKSSLFKLIVGINRRILNFKNNLTLNDPDYFCIWFFYIFLKTRIIYHDRSLRVLKKNADRDG